MVAWWTSRSIRAAATMASPRIFAPLLEAAVGGDDDRAALVPARDEREQEIGGLALEREVPHLVGDEQLVALQPSQFLLELVAVLGCLQLRDPLLRGRERDPVTALAGFEPERDRQVRLARPGRVAELETATSWVRSTSGIDAFTRRRRRGATRPGMPFSWAVPRSAKSRPEPLAIVLAATRLTRSSLATSSPSTPFGCGAYTFCSLSRSGRVGSSTPLVRASRIRRG